MSPESYSQRLKHSGTTRARARTSSSSAAKVCPRKTSPFPSGVPAQRERDSQWFRLAAQIGCWEPDAQLAFPPLPHEPTPLGTILALASTR